MSNLKVANIVNPTTADTTPTDNLSKQVCKAWVNFNGTGTVAIRDSFNVSSITDNGTGDYTVNFSQAMSNTVYCSNITYGNISSSLQLRSLYEGTLYSQRFFITEVKTNTGIDTPINHVQIFGS
jgi:hypothetical protein